MFSKRPAFTLIEVLVTLAISSMILLIGTVSMKFMVTSLAKNPSTLPMHGMTYTEIRNIIAATYPYVIYTKKPFDPNRYDYRFFYEGTENKILFITESPLFSTLPSVVELSLLDKQLWYKESPLYSSSSNYLTPSIDEDSHAQVLFENLENASFSYETNGSISSKISGVIPDNIKLNYIQNDRKYTYIFSIQTDNVPNILHVRRRLETL